MPFPKVENGRVDPQLTNVLLAYTNSDFVAEKIMPTVPNLKDESGVIPRLGNSHLRVYSSKRSLYDTGEHRINYTLDNDLTYKIDYYDLDAYVPDRLQEQLQKPFDAKNAAQKTVMDALMLEREAGLAAMLTDVTVVTNNTTLSGSDQYTDTVNSDPQGDFDTARTTIFDAIGREANYCLMNRKVANTLRRHPFFTERAIAMLGGKATKDGSLSMSAFIETMKAEFDLEEVIIGKSIYVSSKEGQTETKAQVWGNDVVFFYRPSAPSLYTPSFGYSFQLTGYNKQTRTRRHTSDFGDVVVCLWAYQDKILDTDAAYLIKDAVA